MTPDAFNKAVGRTVRSLRLAHGFGQSVLGRACGVSYQQICKAESGLNAFSAFQLSKLAALFNISVACLYEQAGVLATPKPLSAAESDSFLAARYVARIRNPKLRSVTVEIIRKLAYQAGGAV